MSAYYCMCIEANEATENEDDEDLVSPLYPRPRQPLEARARVHRRDRAAVARHLPSGRARRYFHRRHAQASQISQRLPLMSFLAEGLFPGSDLGKPLSGHRKQS